MEGTPLVLYPPSCCVFDYVLGQLVEQALRILQVEELLQVYHCPASFYVLSFPGQ